VLRTEGLPLRRADLPINLGARCLESARLVARARRQAFPTKFTSVLTRTGIETRARRASAETLTQRGRKASTLEVGCKTAGSSLHARPPLPHTQMPQLNRVCSCATTVRNDSSWTAHLSGHHSAKAARTTSDESPTLPLLGRRTEEYRLSNRQSTDASDRAVDSRVVLVGTNDRLHHFWRRTC
jgi:hypothetical protein